MNGSRKKLNYKIKDLFSKIKKSKKSNNNSNSDDSEIIAEKDKIKYYVFNKSNNIDYYLGELTDEKINIFYQINQISKRYIQANKISSRNVDYFIQKIEEKEQASKELMEEAKESFNSYKENCFEMKDGYKKYKSDVIKECGDTNTDIVKQLDNLYKALDVYNKRVSEFDKDLNEILSNDTIRKFDQRVNSKIVKSAKSNITILKDIIILINQSIQTLENGVKENTNIISKLEK